MSWLRIRAIARRHLYVMQRSPHRLFDVTVWPFVDILLFGSLAVFVRQDPGTGGATAFGFLLSGVLLWQVVYQSQIGLATGFLEETWSRNLLSLMVTPMREVEYIAGVALLGLVKVVIGLAIVAVTALGFYAFDITDLGLAIVPVMAVLLAGGWVLALVVIGLVLRFGAGAEALAWGIMFLMLPLSGVFYPVNSLPWVLRPISHALPTTHAFSAARSSLTGSMDWGSLGLAALITAVAAVAAAAFAARMLRIFRERGFVTRYS